MPNKVSERLRQVRNKAANFVAPDGFYADGRQNDPGYRPPTEAEKAAERAESLRERRLVDSPDLSTLQEHWVDEAAADREAAKIRQFQTDLEEHGVEEARRLDRLRDAAQQANQVAAGVRLTGLTDEEHSAIQDVLITWEDNLREARLRFDRERLEEQGGDDSL